MKHQNSQKRFYGECVYFISCKVHDAQEFFQEELFCELWIEELKLCKTLKKFELYAFCLNFDHFHLLIRPDNEIANYSQMMHFLKRNFSYDVNKIMGFIKCDNDDEFPIPLTHTASDVSKHRQNEHENSSSDVWERRLRWKNENDVPKRCPTIESDVPKHRQNEHENTSSDVWERRLRIHKQYLGISRQKFIEKYGNHHNFPKFQWQKSFYDHIIRNQNDFENHWNYTMNNFAKHGLPEHWQYTGLNFPEMLDEME